MKTKPMDDLRAALERVLVEGDGTPETKEFVGLVRCAAAAIEGRVKDLDLKTDDPSHSILLVFALAHHWIAYGYANTGTPDDLCDALCKEGGQAFQGAMGHLGLSAKNVIDPLLRHAIQMRTDHEQKGEWCVGWALEMVLGIYDEHGETPAAALLDAWIDLAQAVTEDRLDNAKHYAGQAIKRLQGLTIREDGAK